MSTPKNSKFKEDGTSSGLCTYVSKVCKQITFYKLTTFAKQPCNFSIIIVTLIHGLPLELLCN